MAHDPFPVPMSRICCVVLASEPQPDDWFDTFREGSIGARNSALGW